MSKLWIVHRSPQVRAALARATGLAPARITSGGPFAEDFPPDEIPDAIVLALPDPDRLRPELPEADPGLAPDRELAFALAISPRVRDARWILITPAWQCAESLRLFETIDAVALAHPPDPTALRREVASAFARRTRAGLAERNRSTRASARVDAWFGATIVPGLERALDRRFAALPLLLRGRPGSGRSLLGLHAEHARGGQGPQLRVDAREPGALEHLAARLESAHARTGLRFRTVWLDEVDALPPSAQRVLAEWIREQTPPGAGLTGPLRWIATAGPAGLEDRIEAALARAFAPLIVEVPPLDPHSGEIARIAAATARDFADQIGAAPRRFAPSALAALADQPLWGDRAELEAILRTTLAHAAREPIEAADLRFPDEREPGSGAASDRPTRSAAADTDLDRAAAQAESASPGGRARDALGALPIEPELDPSVELTRLAERESREAPPDTAAAEATAAATSNGADPAWRKLARSLSHEIRNPLVSIRTFTELLPDHYADETFRARFKDLVGKDVAHIQEVVTRLAKAAARDRLVREPVDVSALVDRLLAARRDAIGRGRLVVLSELERSMPFALADPEALEIALAGLLDRALDALPERGDLFLATHWIARAGDGRPRLRLLLRHHDPRAEGMGGELDPVHHILEYVLAETIVAALGGRLTIDPTQGPETLIVIDLPTPEPGPGAS